MSRYAIAQKLSKAAKARNRGHDYYLNHAYLASMLFGSLDMMWTGTHAEALQMLEKAKKAHAGKRLKFRIEEVE